MVDML